MDDPTDRMGVIRPIEKIGASLNAPAPPTGELAEKVEQTTDWGTLREGVRSAART